MSSRSSTCVASTLLAVVAVGVPLLVFVGCSKSDEAGVVPADAGASPNAAEAGGASPWTEGCGDVVSCSFLFSRLPQSTDCIRSKCGAEIAACGTDGAECARGVRCADDAMAADYASGCFTGADVPSWWCYQRPYACVSELYGQPASYAFINCVIDSKCIAGGGSTSCSVPRDCSAAPADSACGSCLEEKCLSNCHTNECSKAVFCVDACRRSSCGDAKMNECIEECGGLSSETAAARACIESDCSAECCS